MGLVTWGWGSSGGVITTYGWGGYYYTTLPEVFAKYLLDNAYEWVDPRDPISVSVREEGDDVLIRFRPVSVPDRSDLEVTLRSRTTDPLRRSDWSIVSVESRVVDEVSSRVPDAVVDRQVSEINENTKPADVPNRPKIDDPIRSPGWPFEMAEYEENS